MGAEEGKTPVGEEHLRDRYAQGLRIQMRGPDKHAVWKVVRLPEARQPSERR